MPYRKYEMRVTVDVHDSTPIDNDASLLATLRRDITDLASGDVMIINTREPKEV